jgi:integrase
MYKGIDKKKLYEFYNKTALDKIEKYAHQAGYKFNGTESEQLKEKQHIIDRVFEFSSTLLCVNKDKVTTKSVKIIESKLSKVFEQHSLELKLLQLLLFSIEKLFDIKTPPITQIIQVTQEQPLLTPSAFFNSTLHAKLYELIESEKIINQFISSPLEHECILALWLVLKEGITELALIESIINKQANIFLVDIHWVVEFKGRRYWLSPMAELLLLALSEKKQKNAKFKLLSNLNNYLKKIRVLTPIQQIKFSDLIEAQKIEYILKFGSVDYQVACSVQKVTPLKLPQFYRLMTGKQLNLLSNKNEKVHIATVRQRRAWAKGFNRTDTKQNSNIQHDVTAAEQIAVVMKFLNKLDIGNRRCNTVITDLKQELREWLEKEKNANTYPWCWLVLGWLYQLLTAGGKNKANLRLKTIHAYVKYVATSFIPEFSGCDPQLMSSLDWAEKINIAAENIPAATKKAYLIYFAEYLINSDICPTLCLSDIDIEAIGGEVNANIITLKEADFILECCEALPSNISTLAYLVFAFGFYSGLRRGEIVGLQYKDFYFEEDLSYFNLHVRPNKYRELKTSASARNLPLDVLWPEKAQQKLIEYLKTSKNKFTKLTTKIFKDESLINKVFDLITKIMNSALGESSIRFHHCRHSFCNWTWIRINKRYLKPNEEYSFLQHSYFSDEECTRLFQRLGLTYYSRKCIWALASLLGHSTPDTTISSYFHLVEFIRRAKFGCHHPQVCLMRQYWGQRIRVDSWSHVISKPSIEHRLAQYTPQQLKIDAKNMDISVNELIQIHLQIDSKLLIKNDKIDIILVWRIIRRLAEGQNSQQISDALNISPQYIKKIVQINESMVTNGLPKSKNNLPPFANYLKLSPQQIKLLEFFLKRFHTIEQQRHQDLISAGLNNLVKMITGLVSTKDFLIRYSNVKELLTLFSLLKLMKFSLAKLRIKWFFPTLKYYNAKQSNQYRADFLFWYNKIFKEYNFRNATFQVIVPKECRQKINWNKKVENVELKLSDEGLVLPYKEHGFISVHILQTKFKSRSIGQYKQSTGRRTKSFISFLQILVTYLEITGKYR